MPAAGSKGKVLVIEDEKDMARLLRYNLERDGYSVLHAPDAEKGLALLRRGKPDLLILDIMLPRMDGLELCRLIRQESRVPVIFLTAKKSEVDRILGLQLGADDYVTKPFSIGELLARVSAVRRRAQPSLVPTNGKIPLRCGDLEFDPERHEVRVRGRRVDLTHREFQFLRLLAGADGKVLSRKELLEAVWEGADCSEVNTRTVDQHIARLRRKLGPESRRVVTVSSFGYRFLKS